eukprot:1158404-Pelagomonas_calceolata.AAC.6
MLRVGRRRAGRAKPANAASEAAPGVEAGAGGRKVRRKARGQLQRRGPSARLSCKREYMCVRCVASQNCKS